MLAAGGAGWSADVAYAPGEKKIEFALIRSANIGRVADIRTWLPLSTSGKTPVFVANRPIFDSKAIDAVIVEEAAPGEKSVGVTFRLKRGAWEKVWSATRRYCEFYPNDPLAPKPVVGVIVDGKLVSSVMLMSPFFSEGETSMSRSDLATFLKGIPRAKDAKPVGRDAKIAWLEARGKADPADWAARSSFAAMSVARGRPGDYPKAAKVWEAVLDEKPSNRQVPFDEGMTLQMLHRCYMKTAAYDRAAARYKKILERPVLDAKEEVSEFTLHIARLQLIEAYEKLGKHSVALNELDLAEAAVRFSGWPDDMKAGQFDVLKKLRVALKKIESKPQASSGTDSDPAKGKKAERRERISDEPAE